MKHNKLITTLSILLGLGLLAGAAGLLGPINRLREETQLEVVNPLDKSQKELVSEFKVPTMALFTFRSLAINYLWIRADNLKNDGQFFDALYLAQAICALQPNLDSVWDFQGWNMAYNISVEMPTAPERWEWVRAGFELLRDQGLLHNPHSLAIHWSLSWIFQHKMGGITDDYHRYYKLRLPYEMLPLLSPLYSKRMLARPAHEDLEALATIAPPGRKRNWDDLWRELIARPEIAQLIADIRQAEPRLVTDRELIAGLLDFRLHTERYSAALHEFMLNRAGDPALRQLDLWIRSSTLQRQWKLDPGFMLELNRKYGPIDNKDNSIRYSLDWRTPYAHALYWASRGIQVAQSRYPDTYNFDRIRLHRVVYHSLQDMYHYGNLNILVSAPPETHTGREPGQEIYSKEIVDRLQLYNTQDLRMFWPAYNEMLELDRAYAAAGEREPGGVTDGSAYLARAAMQNLYLAGHREAAQRIHNHLKLRFPDDPVYRDTLDAVVARFMREEIESISPRYGSNYAIAALRASYASYGIGNDEEAVIHEQRALRIYERMEKEHWGNPEDDPTKRIELALPNLRWTALMDLLTDASVMDEVKGNLMGRIKTLDPGLYDRVVAEFTRAREDQQGSEVPQ